MLFLLGAVAVVLFALWYTRVYRFNKRLTKFSGPPKHWFLGHALYFRSKLGIMGVLLNFIEDYGETVQIQIGLKKTVLLTIEHRFLEFILPGTKIMKKAPNYQFLNRWLGKGLLINDGGADWKKHRHILIPAFHSNIFETFVGVFESNAKILIEKLGLEVGRDSVDIFPFVTLCSLDIICETAMGTSVNAQMFEESEYVRSVKDMCRILVDRSFGLLKVYDFLYYFTSDYSKEKRAVKVLHDYTDKVIRMRLESRQKVLERSGLKDQRGGSGRRKKMAFLDLLLDEMESQSLTLDVIRQEVDTFMFAGHDTISSAISFAISSLANNPEIQEKAYQEQIDLFAGDLCRSATIDDLKEMKYLELVIKETLRLYPSVPYYARETDKEVDFEGDILPKGLAITIFTYALHRNPKYYPNPEIFDPTRFEKFDHQDRFIYLPFSAGPRNCIGQKFAMLEMKGVLSMLLRHFKFLPAMPRHELQLTSETVLISKNGISVKIIKRQI